MPAGIAPAAWRLVRTGGGALRAAAGRTDPVACRSSLWRGLLAGLSGTAGMAAATVGVRLLTGNGHERRAASLTVLMRRRGRRAKPVGAADAVAARRADQAPEDAENQEVVAPVVAVDDGAFNDEADKGGIDREVGTLPRRCDEGVAQAENECDGGERHIGDA